MPEGPLQPVTLREGPERSVAARQLRRDLVEALALMAREPLASLLESRGLLRPLCREIKLQRLRQSTRFGPAELDRLRQELVAGLACPMPEMLEGDWVGAMPEPLRPALLQRWDQLRLRRWAEACYGDGLEAFFLARRADLEAVVFRMIRVRDRGLADELYLRLVDDRASFGDLAEAHSCGDERWARGLVGPLPIDRPHRSIRSVLERLAPGEVHPPFLVDDALLLIRLEHRLPARLDEPLRQRLLAEMLEADLAATIDLALSDEPDAVPAGWSAPAPQAAGSRR